MRAEGVEEAGRSSVERTDEELCRGIAEGETAAFDQLVERYQARTFRMASAILANEADGRDISQEAFIRLYQNAHRFDGRSRFSTWFHRILVNLCIDHQRRNRWWRKVIPGVRPTNPTTLLSIRPRTIPDPSLPRCISRPPAACTNRSRSYRRVSAPPSCCQCRKTLPV